MLNKLTKGLLFAILIELVLGGGRLVNLGGISLRMIFFSAAMLITAIHIVKGKRIQANYIQLLIAFTSMLLLGLIIGLLSSADKKLIWEDIKPLLFFYLLPFFDLAITDKKDLVNLKSVTIYSSAIMAALFLIILLLINTAAIPFLDFYRITKQTNEFFYRGEYSFYYKAFVYLCIGLVFIDFSGDKNRWWIMTLFALTIFLTFTRGLILALSLTYFCYFILVKKYTAMMALLTVCVVVIFWGKDIYGVISQSLYQIQHEKHISISPDLSTKLLGDREFSDNERKRQIQQVIASTTIKSTLWGHGFGNGIESRPVHMEISYLEIFHKQGMFGLLVWFFIFVSLLGSFLRARHVQPELSYAFFLGASFLFFQSLTNQYINNPIGMGLLLISMVSLNVIEKSPNRDDISAIG